MAQTEHTVCPGCGLKWTMVETEDQICDACGWPNADKDVIDSGLEVDEHD